MTIYQLISTLMGQPKPEPTLAQLYMIQPRHEKNTNTVFNGPANTWASTNPDSQDLRIQPISEPISTQSPRNQPTFEQIQTKFPIVQGCNHDLSQYKPNFPISSEDQKQLPTKFLRVRGSSQDLSQYQLNFPGSRQDLSQYKLSFPGFKGPAKLWANINWIS